MKGEGVFREAPSLRDHRSHREWYSRLPMAALDVGLDFEPDDKVELLVSDLSLARALFELGDASHHEAIGIRLGQTCVLAISVAMFAWYLRTLKADEPGFTAEESPAL